MCAPGKGRAASVRPCLATCIARLPAPFSTLARGLMSFAFLPMYTGDYLRDTRHLTPMRHGVYLLLLFHCWDQRGPLPHDEQECAGIANCRSADEIDALRYVLSRFFVKLDDGW